MQDDDFRGHDTDNRSNESPPPRSIDANDETEAAEPAAPKAIEHLISDNRASTYESCKLALKQAFLRTNGPEAIGKLGESYDAYAANVEANLLKGVPFRDLRQAFENGKGQELHGDSTHPPKMAAIYSSSALVVNTFGPWFRDPSQIILNGHQGFKTMMFEAQIPTGLNGTAPHLDVRLDAKDHVLGIESKCLEYLKPKQGNFAPAYDTIHDQRSQSPWFRHITVLRKDSGHYKYLDAAQLIKHYLGLSHSVPDKSIILLYLYWEPRNWQDIEPFRQHRDEIHRFSKAVAGDPVHFESFSYLELWDQWEQMHMHCWLADYVDQLKARYSLAL